MCQPLPATVQMRENMLMGRALMEQLADVALEASPEIAAKLERICALGHRLVSDNIATIERLDASSAPAIDVL